MKSLQEINNVLKTKIKTKNVGQVYGNDTQYQYLQELEQINLQPIVIDKFQENIDRYKGSSRSKRPFDLFQEQKDYYLTKLNERHNLRKIKIDLSQNVANDPFDDIKSSKITFIQEKFEILNYQMVFTSDGQIRLIFISRKFRELETEFNFSQTFMHIVEGREYKELFVTRLSSDVFKDMDQFYQPSIFVVANNLMYFKRKQEIKVGDREFPQFGLSKQVLMRLDLDSQEGKFNEIEILGSTFAEGLKRYNLIFAENFSSAKYMIAYVEKNEKQIKSKKTNGQRQLKIKIDEIKAKCEDIMVFELQTKRIIEHSNQNCQLIQKFAEQHHYCLCQNCQKQLQVDCDNRCLLDILRNHLVIKQRYDHMSFYKNFHFYQEANHATYKNEILTLQNLQKSIYSFRATKFGAAILDEEGKMTLEICDGEERFQFNYQPDTSEINDQKNIETKQYNSEFISNKLQIESIIANDKPIFFYLDKKQNIHQIFQENNQNQTKKIEEKINKNQNIDQVVLNYIKLNSSSKMIEQKLPQFKTANLDTYQEFFNISQPILIIEDKSGTTIISKEDKLCATKIISENKHAYEMKFIDYQSGMSNESKFIAQNIEKNQMPLYINGNYDLVANCPLQGSIIDQQSNIRLKENGMLLEKPDGTYDLATWGAGFEFLCYKFNGLEYMFVFKEKSTNFFYFIFKKKTLNLQEELISKELIKIRQDNIFVLILENNQYKLEQELSKGTKLNIIYTEIVHTSQSDYFAFLPIDDMKQKFSEVICVLEISKRRFAQKKLKFSANVICQSTETNLSNNMLKSTSFMVLHSCQYGKQDQNITEYLLQDSKQSFELKLQSRRKFIKNNDHGKHKLAIPKLIDGKIQGIQVLTGDTDGIKFKPKFIVDIEQSHLKYDNGLMMFGQRLVKCGNITEQISVKEFVIKDEAQDELTEQEKEMIIIKMQEIMDNDMEIFDLERAFKMEKQQQSIKQIFDQSDIFQPLEILFGQSKLMLYLQNPIEMSKLLQNYDKTKCLVSFDLMFRNILEYSIQLSLSSSVDDLLSILASMKQSQSSYDIIMACLPKLIQMTNKPKILPHLFETPKTITEIDDKQDILSICKLIPDPLKKLPVDSIDKFKTIQISPTESFENLEDFITDQLIQIRIEKLKLQEQDPSIETYDVQHHYIDFRWTLICIKIHRLNCKNHEGVAKYHRLTNLLISDLIVQLHDFQQAFLSPFCMDMIQSFIGETRRHTIWQFKIYLLGFVLPLIMGQMDEQKNDWAQLVFLIWGMIGQAYFSLIEYSQLQCAGGLLLYLKDDPWNISDFLHAFFFTLYFLTKLLIIFTDLQLLLPLAIFSLFTVGFAFQKILFFMRIFEGLGFLVQMLLTTIQQLISFSTFMFISIIFFAQCMQILQVSYPEEDYDIKENYYIVLIQTFRNSVGDIAPPQNNNWVDQGYDDRSLNVITIMQWLTWLLNIYFNQIILLNFLIAVISQVYDAIIANRLYCFLQFQSEFNREYFIYLNGQGKLEEFQAIVLTQDINRVYELPQDVSLGIVNNMKRIVEQLLNETNKNIMELSERIMQQSKDMMKMFETKLESSNTETQYQLEKKQNDRFDQLKAEITTQLGTQVSSSNCQFDQATLSNEFTKTNIELQQNLEICKQQILQEVDSRIKESNQELKQIIQQNSKQIQQMQIQMTQIHNLLNNSLGNQNNTLPQPQKQQEKLLSIKKNSIDFLSHLRVKTPNHKKVRSTSQSETKAKKYWSMTASSQTKIVKKQ